MEETANGNFVFNNTLRRNGNGLGVYANAVGPVTNNFFINNVAEDNRGNGITAGGYGHNPKKESVRNVFVGNTVLNNGGHSGGQINVHHGATYGDVWTANTVIGNGSVPDYAPLVPQNNSAVIIFDP